ncbi:MAG: hypothetical protein ACAH83_13960 [Alphaproteobacteria bacterium]
MSVTEVFSELARQFTLEGKLGGKSLTSHVTPHVAEKLKKRLGPEG